MTRLIGWLIPPAAAAAAQGSDTPELALGRSVYNNHCYFCHGYDGTADTVASTYLSPPPINFTHPPAGLTRDKMINAVTHGKEGTAMQSFRRVLSDREIAAVVDFIRATFMRGKRSGAYYHTPENGWPNMDRYAAAFPFALGKLSLDVPVGQLTPQQRSGRRLFLSSCITCHGRGHPTDQPLQWKPQPPLSRPGDGRLSSPVTAGAYGDYGGGAGVTAPVMANATPAQRRGERLFQANCAYCHAADGSGNNGIGAALHPHPPDLRAAPVVVRADRDKLRRIIEAGVTGTAMSAWGGVLDSGQIDDLIAYMVRVFHDDGAQAQGRSGE